jgi:hypothetical protein
MTILDYSNDWTPTVQRVHRGLNRSSGSWFVFRQGENMSKDKRSKGSKIVGATKRVRELLKTAAGGIGGATSHLPTSGLSTSHSPTSSLSTSHSPTSGMPTLP